MGVDQLAVLVQRAMNDAGFRQRARTDLDGTLAAEGIQPSPEELQAVREFQSETAGLSDQEAQERLASATRRQGVL